MNRWIVLCSLLLTSCTLGGPAADVELAMLGGHPNGTALLRYSPLTQIEKEVTTLEAPVQAQYAHWSLHWNDAGTRLLAWFDQGFSPSHLPHHQMLWEVDASQGRSHRLPMPPAGQISRVGYDRAGIPLLASEHSHATKVNALALSFEGTDYPVLRGGMPISLEDGDPYNNTLRHAFGWRNGIWERLETKAIRLNDDATMEEADELSHFQGIELKGAQLPLTAEEADKGSNRLSRVKELDTLAPLPGGGLGWVALQAGSRPSYLKIEATHTAWLATPLFFESEGRLVKADLEHDYNGLFYLQDRYLLLNRTMPDAVALVDLEARKVIFESSDHRAATFWPVTAHSPR